MKKWILLILVILLFPASVFAEESEDDLALVQKEGILRLGVSPEYIPFVFYEEDTLTGLDVALMEEIGRRMGVKVEPIDFAFDGLIDSLNVRQIDVIGGGFSITEEREQLLDLTHFYFTGDAEFIALASMTKPASIELSNFSNLKIGVEKGTVFEEWIKTNLVKTGYVSSRNIFTYSDLSSAMKALNRKVVDLVLTDGDDFKYAEERRLLYVALTRTRNRVFVLVDEYRPSEFMQEFKLSKSVLILNRDNRSETESVACPKCKTGHLTVRKNESSNKYFVGCSNYPQCDYTVRDTAIMNDTRYCPKCGGFLVKRKGKWGAFYGCSNYPTCDYTEKQVWLRCQK